MIDGVTITPLRQIPDERGRIMHMLRNDAPHFIEFGEVYFSIVHQGAIKGWHLHRKMTINYAVPIGKIKFVLFDARESSPTKGEVKEIFMGPSDNYCLVTVPPGIWNGYKGVGIDSLVANCATHVHDPDEMDRLDPFSPDVPYDWALIHK